MVQLDKVLGELDGLGYDEEIVARAAAHLKLWLTDVQFKDYRPYIEDLVQAKKWEECIDSFHQVIPFGTGGRRGRVGVGPNRFNPNSLLSSVQGHCRFLRARQTGSAPLSVVIAYDVRVFSDILQTFTPGLPGVLDGLTSRILARMCAETYAAAGIRCFFVDPDGAFPHGEVDQAAYVSTPELSYLIRRLGAAGGLNISASHNHPDDNGSKFYNETGGQVVPPDDDELMRSVADVERVGRMPFEEAQTAGLVLPIPAEHHQSYIDLNCERAWGDPRAKVAFSPLCGEGRTTVAETLTKLGYSLARVDEQDVYDGTFAPIRYRIGNPEVPESLERLMEVAQKQQCHLGLATDPDADRLGAIARERDGSYRLFSGNEIGAIILQALLSRWTETENTGRRPIFINTVVTTSLQREIARRYDCQVVGDLCVGFKFMAEVLGSLDQHGRFPPTAVADRDEIIGSADDFIFATEEAIGYLTTPQVRDKDACGAAVVLASLASQLVAENRTLTEYLHDIYRVYGYCRNEQRSLVMEGLEGLVRMRRIIAHLRDAPPGSIGGTRVSKAVDYRQVGGPVVSDTDYAARNILIFHLELGRGRIGRLLVRPSGTEPKMKIYVEIPSGQGGGRTLDAQKNAGWPEPTAGDLEEEMELVDEEAMGLMADFVSYCLHEDVVGDGGLVFPREGFLISDMVSVDTKSSLFGRILPGLSTRAQQGADTNSLQAWLDGELALLNCDSDLIMPAMVQWCRNHLLHDQVALAVLEQVLSGR